VRNPHLEHRRTGNAAALIAFVATVVETALLDASGLSRNMLLVSCRGRHSNGREAEESKDDGGALHLGK
jgi:hypothetical protein